MEKSKGLLGLATFQSRSVAKKDFDGFGDVVNVQFLGDHRAQCVDGRTDILELIVISDIML